MQRDSFGEGYVKREDLRVVKTKKSLLDSFLKLLSEKTFEDITVNELCIAAGVRRATFYKHYEDRIDFLFGAVKMLRDRFDSTVWRKKKPSTAKDYYVEYVKSLITYLEENFLAVTNLLKSGLRGTLVNVITKQNFEETCERLKKSVEGGAVLPASVETTALMLVGGIAQILVNWIGNGMPVTADRIFGEIEALVSAIIKN